MATKNCKNGCDLKGSRSHAKGGIKGVVEGSQKQIEVESNEVIIRASVLNDPKRYIYTGTHRQIVEQINGGFNSVVNDSDDCILVEAGQVVINKKTLDDDKIRTYTGTNKEVLNKINKHLNSGVSIYKNGGIIPIGNNKIKTIFFKKDKFTKPQAIAWAKNHGFDYAQSYDENKSNYIFRCNDKNAFKKHTYRTIELKESGIKIIIGVEKMEQGGSVEDVYELDFYQVTQSSERDTDCLYQGIDFDKAKSEYNYASEQDDDTNVILEKYTNKYKFVYELDADNEETIDDYPIEDYYEDSDYYKLVENGLDSGTEILESKELHRVKSNKENIEEEFEQLQSDFIDSFENDYKNKIHLQEYAGFMGSSKYYYLLIDENGSLIDVDKENPLLLLEKKDSTFDDRIARSFQNINPENAVLCVRISDHERVYNTYGDACLSIVFDRKSDRIEIQNTDSDNENIIELVYGIEKYFDNYSIAELSDVEYSVKSVIDDFDYNNMIQNRGEFEDDEYKQGGSITQNTISENRKEFMIRESKMNNFVRTFYSDIQSKYPIKIDNTHDKFQMFGVKGHFEFLIPLDKMEGEILMYFEMLTNRSMADFLNTKGDVIVTPVIKCYIDKDYNITFDYSELDKYLGQYGVEEFKEGGEVIRKTKNTPFTQLCNVFKSEMERDYGFKFTENSDNFNSRYGNGHVEFTMKKDDKDATAFIYFEGKRGFPIIFGFDEKGDYYADYSTFETVLKLIKRKEFAEGGEVESKNDKKIEIGDTILYAQDTNLRLLGVQELIKKQQYKVSEYKVLNIYQKNGYNRIEIVNIKGKKIIRDKYFDNEFKEIVRLSEIYLNNWIGFKNENQSKEIQNKIVDELLDQNLKDEVIQFFKENNVDVDKLHFKYSKESKYQKNRYKNAEEEVWVFLNDKKYNKRGKELETSFVLTRSDFESYKKMGRDGIDLLIYGNQLPLIKDKLQGGLSDNKTILDISKKHNVSLDFANEQFEKGISVEMEHADSRDVASEIALDHLWESINYYIELEKMEKKLDFHKINDNRKIDYTKMKKSILEKLLKKENIDLFDALDLEDFKYLILAEPHNAFESGLMDKLQVSQKGEAYSMKNKFWITNIDFKLKDFYSKDIFIPNKSTKHEIEFACQWADRNNKKISIDVSDDKVEYYKSLGFVVKN